MTNVDTLRFLIDQANRMDDDTPKKVRRHMVDLLAEAVQEAVGANLEVGWYEGRADDGWRWWQVQVMKCTGYPCMVWLQSRELCGAGSDNWISAEWVDAAETLLEAAAYVERGDTPRVANIRAAQQPEQAAPPSFEELVTRAGGRVVPDGVDVLAVWPNGATGENPDPDVAFGPVPPTGIQTHEGRLVWTGTETDALTIARATGATCVGSDARSPVSAVWPDGRFLRTGDGGYFMSWPDGRCKWHHDLSVALDCDGECEQ